MKNAEWSNMLWTEGMAKRPCRPWDFPFWDSFKNSDWSGQFSTNGPSLFFCSKSGKVNSLVETGRSFFHWSKFFQKRVRMSPARVWDICPTVGLLWLYKMYDKIKWFCKSIFILMVRKSSGLQKIRSTRPEPDVS